jgi:gamma-glutamyltranspeptidase
MVGAELCVGVIGMYHSGIGGGGFMLVRGAEGHYETIDFRESAPAAAFQDMYKHDVNASVHGGLSVAVPGELRGLEYLHTKYGVSSLPESVCQTLPLLIVGKGIALETSSTTFCAARTTRLHGRRGSGPIYESVYLESR